MKLFSRIMGNGPQPLIILHGLFGSSDNWLSVAKLLQEEYTLHLLDARNHGQSPHNSEFNYKVMAEDLKQYLDEQFISNPILIGHSMGGKTVMRFAYEYPTIAKKIIVVDISPRFYDRHHQTIFEAFDSVKLSTIQTRNEADQAMQQVITDVGVRQFLLKNLYRNEEGLFAWRIHLDLIKEKIDVIGEELPTDHRVETPTLFIRGALSGYIEENDTVLIQQCFTNAKVETVENASHWVHAEAPAKVVTLIKSFIQS
jgi:pimeloyl-ACP methyl ester carboxylesterase